MINNENFKYALEYLKKRNLSKKEVIDFKIGYVPQNPNFFENFKSKFNDKKYRLVDFDWKPFKPENVNQGRLVWKTKPLNQKLIQIL